MQIAGVDIAFIDGVVSWCGPSSVNADGSPNAYCPIGSGLQHLDDLANAGHPGNWWALVTDTGKKDGSPVIQKSTDPAPGNYISTTALVDHTKAHDDPARYVDSQKVCYVVIPPEIKEQFNASMGDLCWVNNTTNGRTCAAVVADVGPRGHIGEFSIAANEALGLSGDARHGGTSRPCIAVKLFVRSAQGWPRTNEEISAQVSELMAAQSIMAT